MFLDQIQRKTDEEILAWIQHIIDEREKEDLVRDYKAMVNLTSTEDKRELAKDMTAFANTVGGALLIGIEEERDSDGRKTGVPSGEYGIDRAPDLETKIRQILEDTISPRISNLVFREIKISEEEDKYVYVVYHQKSWMRPHMVSGYNDKRHYKRSQDRNVPMEHWEVEDLLRERLRYSKSKEEYLKTIHDGSELIKKDEDFLTFKIILLPLPVNEEMIDIFRPSGKNLWEGVNFMFQGGGHRNWRPCEDGVVLHQYAGTATESPYVVKIHPTGAVSFCIQDVARFMSSSSFPLPRIFTMALPRGTREFLSGYLEKLAFSGDILVQISAGKITSGFTSGLRDADSFTGILNAHPEYLNSDTIMARTLTSSRTFIENLRFVVDELLNDMGRKIGVWNYADLLRNSPEWRDDLRNDFGDADESQISL